MAQGFTLQCPGRFTTLLLGIFCLLLACARPEPIRIGFVAGTSGRVSDLGIAGRNAAIMAVEDKNSVGGIGGRAIELLIKDDEQNADSARRAVQELIDIRVEAIVGHMTSSMSAVTLPLANKARIPMVSPTSTSRDFTGKDDYFLRVVADTRNYAAHSAKHHYNALQARRMAIVYDLRNRSYCESWADDYSTAFRLAGGQIIQSIGFESGADIRFDALAQKILASQPDGIVIIANAVDAALIAQQVRLKNRKVILAGAEWTATEQLIELGGSAVEGMVIAQFVDRSSQAPAYLAFRRKYLERFGIEPGFAGLATYDAMTAILTALEKRSPGQSVKDSIIAIRDFEGLQDRFSIDAYGDSVRNHFMTVIRNGAFARIQE